MAKVLSPITACLKKGQNMEEKEVNVKDGDEQTKDVTTVANNTQQGSLLWRMSSGIYNIGSGAVGLGVGGVKWAASTTYSVGSGVVSTVGSGVVSTVGSGVVKKVVSKVIPSAIPKPKKE